MRAIPLESRPFCWCCSNVPYTYLYLEFVETREVDPDRESVWRTGPQQKAYEEKRRVDILEEKD